MYLPHPRVKVSIVGSLRDREVAFSVTDRQGSNFKSCVWRTVPSQSSPHPQEVLLAQFSIYVHKGGLKLDSFHLYTTLYQRFKGEATNEASLVFDGQYLWLYEQHTRSDHFQNSPRPAVGWHTSVMTSAIWQLLLNTMLSSCRAIVYDAGPTSNQHWSSILLGSQRIHGINSFDAKWTNCIKSAAYIIMIMCLVWGKLYSRFRITSLPILRLTLNLLNPSKHHFCISEEWLYSYT